jgi:CheY-like chemotaxis protein
MTSTLARETHAAAPAPDLALPAAAGNAPTARALLADILNRTQLLDYAIAQVETATALGGRPAQRNALRALHHTIQLVAADMARVRQDAERSELVRAGSAFNEDWLAPVAVEPRPVDAAPARAPRTDEPIDLPRGTEKLLLVDDDDAGRDATAALLRQLGYQVHDSPTGEAALAHLAANPDPVSLLITSARLPGMQGRQLAESVVSWHPGARVVYAVSGDGFTEHGAADGFRVDRPIRPSELAAKVREVLDG